MDLLKTIVQSLPYTRPFLFVDELSYVNDDSCEGFYTFREDEFFYQGHFKDRAVTPGVILIECMAQIGLVCLGMYLVQGSGLQTTDSSSLGSTENPGKVMQGFVFSESRVLFEKAVYPGERVRVVSHKKYWRMGKLKCRVEMYHTSGERICNGELSGIMIYEKQ